MDYYVSPKNGDDGASGSRTHAWRTIGKALQVASNGDIIYVMGPLVVGKDIYAERHIPEGEVETFEPKGQVPAPHLRVVEQVSTAIVVADADHVEEAVDGLLQGKNSVRHITIREEPVDVAADGMMQEVVRVGDSMMVKDRLVRRGRGRPPGSKKKPRQGDLEQESTAMRTERKRLRDQEAPPARFRSKGRPDPERRLVSTATDEQIQRSKDPVGSIV